MLRVTNLQGFNSFTPSAGAKEFRSLSVGGTEGNIGANTGNGLIYTMPSSPVPDDDWVLSWWQINLDNRSFATYVATTTGGASGTQFYRQSTGSTFSIAVAGEASDDNIASYTADTWNHHFLRFVDGGQWVYYLNNTLEFTNPTNVTLGEMAGASCVWHVLQDDGEDADADAGIYDFIGLNGADLSAMVPTDVNFSTASGGEWIEFDDFGNAGYSSLSFQLNGGNSSSLGDDGSGNGNHFSVSTGGSDPIVDRTSDGFIGLPPGA